MKLLNPFVGVLLLGLCVSTSQADINLILRNKQYLPPPIQDLPVDDDYYNSQDNTRQQQTFEEKNYANSKYEIFEVHNLYKPAVNNGKKNNYSALQKKSTKIRVEHINAPTDFPSDDPNLDAYLSITAFKGPDYLPPRQQGFDQFQQSFISNNNFDGSDCSPPHQHGSSHSHGNFRQDYLKPHQHGSGQSEQSFMPKPQFRGSDYLPPQKQTPHQSSYNGPENLSIQTNIKATHYPDIQENYEKSINLKPSVKFNGPGYLPPEDLHNINQNTHQQQQVTSIQSNGFSGPGYLPPHQQYKSSRILKNTAFKGPDYLPPLEGHFEQSPQQSLPPGYEFQRPPNAEQAIAELHKLPEESQTQFSGGKQSSNIVHDTTKQSELALKKDIFSSGYNFQNLENSEQSINPLHNQKITTNIQPLRVSKYSLPMYHFQKTYSPENARTDSSQQHNLPLNYDLKKSGHDEEAVNRLNGKQNSYKTNQAFVTEFSKSSQSDSHQDQRQSKTFAQSALHPFGSPDYLSPTTGSYSDKGPNYSPPTFSSQTYKSPEYFPLTTTSHTFNGHDYLPPPTGSQNYKDPKYLPPADSKHKAVSLFDQQISEELNGRYNLAPGNVKQPFDESYQTQFKGPEYLPPKISTNTQGLNPPIMYSLSSYMNNVKPNDRYGNRMPFSEYGLPPAETATLSSNNDISPMYREPASRPPYYAPTMSYTNNAFNGQTSDYNVSTIALKAPTTLSTIKPSKAKIRTVQIFNPNDVKTLKVLESSDHSGVKTIKILGPSHEQPMGDHSVIKVVSGTHEASVQTVKFFNDYQDVTHNANGAVTVEQSSSYLPPRSKRNSKNKIKGKERTVVM